MAFPIPCIISNGIPEINTLVDENKKRLEAEAKGETYFYNIPKINKDKL